MGADTSKTISDAGLDSETGRSVVAKFFRALGDPNRLALLQFISKGEHSASECIEYLGITQSRASSHLACLVACGLVAVRRESRFALYRVVDPRVLELVNIAVEVTADHSASIAACLRVEH